MEVSPDGQISLIERDARSMASKGTGVVGYNVQTAVDTDHHLIVAREVTNVGSDRHQLKRTPEQAREAVGSAEVTAPAERSYYSGEEIKACADTGIVPLVPKVLTSNSKAKGRYDTTTRSAASTTVRRPCRYDEARQNIRSEPSRLDGRHPLLVSSSIGREHRDELTTGPGDGGSTGGTLCRSIRSALCAITDNKSGERCMRALSLAGILCLGTFCMLALAPELHAASDYQENFDSGQAQGWSTFNGTWTVSAGAYGTSTNINPTISVYDDDTWQTGFTYELRAFADWFNTGNNVSAVFAYQDEANFYEVQFNVQGGTETSGSVTIKRVAGGTATTVGTPHQVSDIPADQLFDVQITVSGSKVSVRVNNTPVINDLTLPAAPANGRIGVLSRNNVVKFDDVSVTRQRYSETFQSGSAQGWSTVNGAWNVVNGYYANAVTSGMTLSVFEGSSWTTDFTYAARVYLDWYNTGNHGGLIFGYQDQNNFYEVSFNVKGPEDPDGSVTIKRISAGAATTVATGTINVPPDAWFNAQLSLNGSDITVSVDGNSVASAALSAAPNAGRIGVISRNNQARFDEVSVLVGAGGILQFKSGFEPLVALGTQTNPKFTGTDQTAPAGKNDWDLIATYLPWITKAEGYLEGGSFAIVNDPAGSTNKVLRLRNTRNPDTTENYSRSEYQLNQPGSWELENGPNLFDRQFYRYRMYIPSAITSVVQANVQSPWYMIWESHAWTFDDTRHGISLFKEANSSLWTFRVVQQDDPPNGTILYENTAQQTIAVPFNQWFTLDVFFRYHATNGRFYVAITRQGQPRQVVANYVGPTKYGTKLHDQLIFKMYHDDHYIDTLTETRQYYDDLEIWNDFPPGYNP